MSSGEPCAADCDFQNYPNYPYDSGDEPLFSKVLPIVLSAMVVVISWLAGRFIDKIDISTQGSINRGKLGTVAQSVKRSTSHEKAADFHSSARGMGPRGDGSVQELDRLSIADDEGRLYNEQYGSEHSQEDGDRYDALGDSPGAPGPSRQVPRSPSVYSQFSQSMFSQSAYGPSAYGPSQRRLTGSVYGHSQYENASSQGSQYPGPVPSHFGASQLSENTSYHASGSGGSGVIHHPPGGAFIHGNIPAPYGGDMGRGAGMIQRVPPPMYNPYASRQAVGGVATGRGVGIVGMRAGVASGQGSAAGGLAVAHEGVAVSGFNRGSPPPYSQAQMVQAQAQAQGHAPALVLPNDPRQSQLGAVAPLAGVSDAGPRVTPQTASLVAPPPALMAHASGLPPVVPAAHASVSIVNPAVSAMAPAENPVGGVSGSGHVSGTAGPKSGFGSDSDDGATSEVPSAFRP